MRRRNPGFTNLKNPVKLVCIIISTSFITIQIITSIHLNSISPSKTHFPLTKPTSKIGRFGETLIGMLPSDLAFTLFLPSDEAFRGVLRLSRNDSDSYAVLTRVLGFSAVPRWVSLADLECGEEREYDSVSGFKVCVWKNGEGMVVVNGVVVSEVVGLKLGSVLVHVMDGVVMDAEFEESVQQPDDDDEER